MIAANQGNMYNVNVLLTLCLPNEYRWYVQGKYKALVDVPLEGVTGHTKLSEDVNGQKRTVRGCEISDHMNCQRM